MKKEQFLKVANITEREFSGMDEIKGSPYLSSLTSIPEGFNKIDHEYQNISPITHFSWQDGKYIRADDMFTEVLHIKGNIRKVRQLNRTKEFYLITDGKGNYAHGDTIKDAQQDLLFKTNNRSKEDYKNLTLDSKLDFADAVICYRVITVACLFGTKDFLENRLEHKQEKYSIKEIIKLTNSEYGGNFFKSFFDK